MVSESKNNYKAIYKYMNPKTEKQSYLMERDLSDITTHKFNIEPLSTLHITREKVYIKFSSHNDKSPGLDEIHLRFQK